MAFSGGELCQLEPESIEKHVNGEEQQGVDVADVPPQWFLLQRGQLHVLLLRSKRTRLGAAQPTDQQNGSAPARCWFFLGGGAGIGVLCFGGSHVDDEVNAGLPAEPGPPGQPVQLQRTDQLTPVSRPPSSVF